MMARNILATIRAQTIEQMYVFTVLALLLMFLVKYLTHEAANETMIAVLNTAIGGVSGMLGMAVAQIFGAQKNAGGRATDAGGVSATVGVTSSGAGSASSATIGTPGATP